MSICRKPDGDFDGDAEFGKEYIDAVGYLSYTLNGDEYIVDQETVIVELKFSRLKNGDVLKFVLNVKDYFPVKYEKDEYEYLLKDAVFKDPKKIRLGDICDFINSGKIALPNGYKKEPLNQAGGNGVYASGPTEKSVLRVQIFDETGYLIFPCFYQNALNPSPDTGGENEDDENSTPQINISEFKSLLNKTAGRLLYEKAASNFNYCILRNKLYGSSIKIPYSNILIPNTTTTHLRRSLGFLEKIYDSKQFSEKKGDCGYKSFTYRQLLKSDLVEGEKIDVADTDTSYSEIIRAIGLVVKKDGQIIFPINLPEIPDGSGGGSGGGGGGSGGGSGGGGGGSGGGSGGGGGGSGGGSGGETNTGESSPLLCKSGTKGTKGSSVSYEKVIEKSAIFYPEFLEWNRNDCPIQKPCLSDITITTIYKPDKRIEFDCKKKNPPPPSTPPLFPVLAKIANFAKETNGYAEADPKSKEIAGLGDS